MSREKKEEKRQESDANLFVEDNIMVMEAFFFFHNQKMEI